MKDNRKEALQETAKDETLGVRRKPQASSDASTSGSATEVAFYELDVKMLVDSWVYGGIADLIKQMPEGVLGVNVLGIKKQEGAWDSTCLSSVMQDYEENKTREEQKPNSSLSERPIHEWDSLAEDMDVRVESHKKNMAEEQKLIAVQKG
jgi:hypothetical protein